MTSGKPVDMAPFNKASHDRLGLSKRWGPLVVLVAIAGAIFMQRAYFLFRLVRLGQPVKRTEDMPKRLENEVVVVLGQRKLLQRAGPGLMHAFIFWGFLILLTTIVEVVGEQPAGVVERHLDERRSRHVLQGSQRQGGLLGVGVVRIGEAFRRAAPDRGISSKRASRPLTG